MDKDIEKQFTEEKIQMTNKIFCKILKTLEYRKSSLY